MINAESKKYFLTIQRLFCYEKNMAVNWIEYLARGLTKILIAGIIIVIAITIIINNIKIY